MTSLIGLALIFDFLTVFTLHLLENILAFFTGGFKVFLSLTSGWFGV
jgi:hypothetical protein